MRNVYVLGTGLIKFGRYPEKTVPELGGEAAEIALKDAGVKIQDVQFFACGNLYQANAMVGQRILQQIGQTGIPVVNCANACATGATAFREAWMAIKADVYDVCLAVGVEQMGRGLLGGGAPRRGRGGRRPAVLDEMGHGGRRRQGERPGREGPPAPAAVPVDQRRPEDLVQTEGRLALTQRRTAPQFIQGCQGKGPDIRGNHPATAPCQAQQQHSSAPDQRQQQRRSQDPPARRQRPPARGQRRIGWGNGR